MSYLWATTPRNHLFSSTEIRKIKEISVVNFKTSIFIPWYQNPTTFLKHQFN